MPAYSVCLPTFAGGSALTNRIEWTELEAFALKAESLGYSAVWVADHFVLGHEGGEHEAWTAISALAAATSKIRIGTLVLGNTHRNPALVAKMAATLDYLSGGRLNLGIGAGWYKLEQESYGLPWVESVKERMDRLQEAIELMKALFTQEPVTFRGRFYRVTDAPCQPAPIQKPWPRIWIGGGGEQRTLRIVAKHADAWNIPAVTPEEYARKSDVLRQHCEAVGREYNEIERTMETRVLVTDGSFEADNRLADWLNHWRRTAGHEPLANEAAINQARSVYVIGTVDECRAKVEAYVKAGVEHFTPYFLDYPETTSLEIFARDIMGEPGGVPPEK